MSNLSLVCRGSGGLLVALLVAQLQTSLPQQQPQSPINSTSPACPRSYLLHQSPGSIPSPPHQTVPSSLLSESCLATSRPVSLARGASVGEAVVVVGGSAVAARRCQCVLVRHLILLIPTCWSESGFGMTGDHVHVDVTRRNISTILPCWDWLVVVESDD